jgi:hypothetical protein
MGKEAFLSRMDDEDARYKEFGLTRKAFLELVDFFRELIRLDEEPYLIRMHRRRLIRVLRRHLNVLKEDKRRDLLQQLEDLKKSD